MFGTQKRIFAHKHDLHAEPLCPYLSDSTGFYSLNRSRTTQVPRPIASEIKLTDGLIVQAVRSSRKF